MKLRVKRDFQRAQKVGGRVLYDIEKQGSIIEASEKEIRDAMAEGFKNREVHGRYAQTPVAGILNHCEPADEEAKALFEEFFAAKE